MSCILLSPMHFQATIGWEWVRQGCADTELWAELANALYQWNVTAYCQRYKERPQDVTYFQGYMAPANHGLTPAQVIVAIESIDYQCSDADGWDESIERQQLMDIKDWAIDAMIPDEDRAAYHNYGEGSGW